MSPNSMVHLNPNFVAKRSQTLDLLHLPDPVRGLGDSAGTADLYATRPALLLRTVSLGTKWKSSAEFRVGYFESELTIGASLHWKML